MILPESGAHLHFKPTILRESGAHPLAKPTIPRESGARWRCKPTILRERGARNLKPNGNATTLDAIAQVKGSTRNINFEFKQKVRPGGHAFTSLRASAALNPKSSIVGGRGGNTTQRARSPQPPEEGGRCSPSSVADPKP